MERKIYEFISQQTNDPIVEWKVCPSTGEEFALMQSDLNILDKLSPIVAEKKISLPLPTHSPRARQIRRLLFRNEWNFYNAQSDKSGKKIFSIYSPDSGIDVYEREEWWNDDWDPMHSGKDINLDKSISEQIKVLRKNIPAMNVVNVDNENCTYVTGVGYSKDCYLINSSENSENCYYGKLFQNCKNCMDCSYVYDSDMLYQCINVKKSYHCMYFTNSQECSSCYFSEDLVGCSDCMFCTGLGNAHFCFENQQYSKEEYEEKKLNYLGSRKKINIALEKFKDIQTHKIARYSNILHSQNVYGDFLSDDKNCLHCYDVDSSEDCRYLNVGVQVKSIYDCNNIYLGSEKNYENLGTMGAYGIYFSSYIFDSSTIFYSQDCYDSKYLFGCIGLRNKEYCIFNKQYSKEEYEKLFFQIIKKMETDGEWGEFFPTMMAPFPYNDSLAMEYFPVHKIIFLDGQEKIINSDGKGIVYIQESDSSIVSAFLDLGGEEKIPITWRLKESDINIPENMAKINALDVPENIQEVQDDILQQILLCEITGRPFRIMKPELEFYRLWGLPLPTKHPNERYQERLKKKAKRELYVRSCNKCGNGIFSVYAENIPFKVYCETCYNKEIYG